jgi:hypothetical protein
MRGFAVALALCLGLGPSALSPASAPRQTPARQPSAGAAELWGSIRTPGTGPGLRRALGLGDPERAESLLVFDFARRYFPRVDNDAGGQVLDRYVRFMTAVEAGAAGFPGGVRLPEASTPRAERDAARDFIELLGLELKEQRGTYLVEARDGDDARERQVWLAANGWPARQALDALNGGQPFKVDVGSVEIPLPLPAYWHAEVFRRNEHPLVSLAKSRTTTFAYVGLASLDDETLEYFGARPALVRDILGDSPGAFAAFGRSLRIRDGVVQPPGGVDAVALWQRLADRRPADTDRFIRSVLSRDSGRLAWFYDLVAHLDPPRLGFVIGTQLLPGERIAFGERVYSWFRGTNGHWNAADQPFARPAFDPASAVAFVDVLDGGLVGPPWWPSVLQRVSESDDWPTQPDRTTRALKDVPADAGWLLWWLFENPDGALGRFQVLRLAQRLFNSAPRASAPALEISLRVLRDMPALAWSLERMGVTDPALFSRVGWAGRALTNFGDGDEAVTAIGRWQAALGLLEQVQLRRGLDPAVLTKLLLALADTVQSDAGRFRGAVAGWVAEHLLPAVTTAGLPPEDIEPAAIEGFVRRQAPGLLLTWEGLPYVVDEAGPVIKQVLAVRAARRSPRLGHLAVLNDARRRVEREVKTLGEVKALAADLASVEDGVRSLSTDDGGPHELSRDYREAVQTLTRITRDRDISRARRTLDVMVRLLDAFADAILRSLAYAVAGAPTDEPPDLSADAWRRHVMQRESAADLRPVRQLVWQRSTAVVLARGGAVVRGAYLALDLALAESRLRSTARSPVAAAGAFEQLVSRAIVESVVMWQTEGPRRSPALERAASAIRAGRAAVSRWTDSPPPRAELRPLLQRARVDEARQNLILWLAERSPAKAASALTITELYRLGAADPAAPAWGGSSAPIDGCLCLSALGPWTPEDVRGWASGALGSTLADVPLRLAEEVTALQLPAALTPAVLPMALRDWTSRVDQTSADDWIALTLWPRQLAAERVEEYLLQLVADGMLAPPKVLQPAASGVR